MDNANTPEKFETLSSILGVFRIVAAEFSPIGDETVLSWLALTVPMVSRKLFGTFYEQAVALLTAHRMKLAGCEENQSAGNGGASFRISDTLRVSSYSEGETSISFNGAATSTLADAELTLTAYGMQFLSLRRMVIMPIRCSGESRQ